MHNEDNNDTNATILVPMFIEMFQPKSVCDVGCGLGAFLGTFKKNGINEVSGFDGEWADREKIRKYLADTEFTCIDLEQEIPTVAQKYDLVLNFEVAEHINEMKSDNLIEFLTKLSDTVIFSAAIPGQGGYKHINEQWEEYWEEKFIKRGYKKYDIIRHKIFADKNITYWYRQNMLVYSNKDLSHFTEVKLPNIITPELFTIKNELTKTMANHIKGGAVKQFVRKLIKW